MGILKHSSQASVSNNLKISISISLSLCAANCYGPSALKLASNRIIEGCNDPHNPTVAGGSTIASHVLHPCVAAFGDVSGGDVEGGGDLYKGSRP
ncbi:hypothetical protein CsSME_00048462 [Camellia sinensis var. sinensis]|uniref:Uncharacterized protein n=1 Tax=Camellia sinensis TaxID=4442 RepID=A0A7J7GC07_CAMSI|nr:hypothetical protein HYC85_024332 [Camellia sinensis]